jgi:hypothetical protein
MDQSRINYLLDICFIDVSKVKNPPPLGQDCDRIGELVDEAIHQDNMAKVRTIFIKPAEISLGFFHCTEVVNRGEYRQ